jgi:hypothetical protein
MNAIPEQLIKNALVIRGIKREIAMQTKGQRDSEEYSSQQQDWL